MHEANCMRRGGRMGRTLTEVLAQNRIQGRLVVNTASSNARTIPYAEEYRASTGQQETPVERLQRIADEDARERANT